VKSITTTPRPWHQQQQQQLRQQQKVGYLQQE
jgi:hypothetical protein